MTGTTTRALQPPSPDLVLPRAGSEMLDPAEGIRSYERSPADLLRLLVSTVAAIGIVVVTKVMPDAVGGVQADFVDLLAVRSADLVRALEGLLVLTTVGLLLVTLLLPLLTRRLRIFGYVILANVLCAVVMGAVDAWLDIDGAVSAVAAAAGVEDLSLPDATGIAQTLAAVIVFLPFVTQRWRRMLWSLFILEVVLQVMVSVHPPATTAVALAVGPAVGSATLLLFGRPLSRPTIPAIRAALATSGLPVTAIEPASVDARGSTPYFVDLADGSRVFAKVLGANERAADLLFRLYRRLRLKNVGDERPDASLRRTVEHEALVSLQARDVGVTTPRLRAVAQVGQDSFLLAYDLIPGKSLDAVPRERLTDQVLTAVWEQVALLHRHRIAHRDLRLANLFLDDGGAPWVIDFGFAEVAADELLLRADVAQLLSSLATAVGPQRAIDAAVGVLGPDAVGASVGRLQEPALSGATRTALKAQPGLLEELRADVSSSCGVDQPRLDPLTRFRPSNGVTLVLAAVTLYLAVPVAVGFDDVASAVGGADWGRIPWLLGAVAVAELALAWQLSSSVSAPIPAAPTVLASLASVFASTTAPSQLGGSSLRVRFLERHGTSPDTAEAAVGLASSVTTVSRVVLLGAALLWGGRSAFDSVDIDRPLALRNGLGVLAVLALLAFLVPGVRRRVLHSLRAGRGRAHRGARELAASPGRLTSVAVASALAVMAQVAALQAAGEIIGFNTRIATTAVVFLAGMLLATLAPTPGHLVAVEVVLVAGLVATGLPTATAVTTVLLYRLAAFWLPLLLGGLGFTRLRSSGLI